MVGAGLFGWFGWFGQLGAGSVRPLLLPLLPQAERPSTAVETNTAKSVFFIVNIPL